MVAPKCAGQKITAVRYSTVTVFLMLMLMIPLFYFLVQVRPSLLGTSCESGIVSFWDCNASKNLFNLAPHCR